MNKHYIRVDESGLVTKAFSNAFEKALETDICVNENGGRHYNLSLLREDGLPKYKYDNGLVLTTDEDLKDKILEILKDTLRNKRNTECYSIVNRGKLWYDTLSVQQVIELTTWYNDWLDVTVTLIAPTKLDWL